MKKPMIIIGLLTGTLLNIGFILTGLLSLIIISGQDNQASSIDTNQLNQKTSSPKVIKEEVKQTCDGTTVISNCKIDGINYITYIYHPAVAEKSHIETTTTYEEKITGYCTLCNDGTYSPTCATGSGACSHHGGVAQWNAPMRSKVPIQTNRTVIDAPAQEAYYEKVVE